MVCTVGQTRSPARDFLGLAVFGRRLGCSDLLVGIPVWVAVDGAVNWQKMKGGVCAYASIPRGSSALVRYIYMYIYSIYKEQREVWGNNPKTMAGEEKKKPESLTAKMVF